MHTNHLIDAASPYLLQHAHNPVNWYPWGDEALTLAEKEDKPLLVSIGYSACHWCHVMERESFEDEDTARMMNKHFVCIKIDREERPDLDHIYMEAVQALTGHGGWPLNVFLTPDRKPFYGGTYFPPEPAYNRPSWKQILSGLSDAFKNKREEVVQQASRLMDYMNSADRVFTQTETQLIAGLDDKISDKLGGVIYDKLSISFDTVHGGFGSAPKFPGTMTIQFLLRDFHFRKNEAALRHALLSLDKMMMGGIYDQLGGGFARYSTDDKWLAPHFEKMLYDNALLVVAMNEVVQLLGPDKSGFYKNHIRQTLAFVKRELMSTEGAFYTAIDADSEGEEGKFYVWSHDEVMNLLGEEGKLFCEFYDITPQGNWEGKNILYQKIKVEDFAERNDLKVADFKMYLETSGQKLFDRRSERPRPMLDDKILLSMNALMCSAFCKAYSVIQEEGYLTLARTNMEFMLTKFTKQTSSARLQHAYKNGVAYIDAMLDDYAYLVDALLNLYEISFDDHLLTRAKEITDFVIKDFFDQNDGYFFYNAANTRDVIVRKKDFYDSATPSANSTMAKNLQRLAVFYDDMGYVQIVSRMLGKIKESVVNYPSSFSQWANVILNEIYSMNEIAVVGENSLSIAGQINREFIPNKVMMASTGKQLSSFPLLQSKPLEEATQIFLCKHYTCQKPVSTLEEFINLLDQK